MSEGSSHGAAVFERDASVLWRRAGERVLVLGPDGDVHELDGSGAVLWELLAEPVPYDQLLMTLAQLYEEPVHRIDADLAPALGRFEALGIVRRVPDAADDGGPTGRYPSPEVGTGPVEEGGGSWATTVTSSRSRGSWRSRRRPERTS